MGTRCHLSLESLLSSEHTKVFKLKLSLWVPAWEGPVMLYLELQFKQGFERASRIDLQVRRRTTCQRNRNGHTRRQCQVNIKDILTKKKSKRPWENRQKDRWQCQIEEGEVWGDTQRQRKRKQQRQRDRHRDRDRQADRKRPRHVWDESFSFINKSRFNLRNFLRSWRRGNLFIQHNSKVSTMVKIPLDIMWNYTFSIP